MKENEFRIGNHVNINIKEIDKYFTNGTITKICKDDVYVNGFKIPLEHLEPIVLTEDWLIDFGFEKDGYKDNRSYYFILNEIKINIYDNKFFLDNPNEQSGKRLFIPHVHQLQNLYYERKEEELLLIIKTKTHE